MATVTVHSSRHRHGSFGSACDTAFRMWLYTPLLDIAASLVVYLAMPDVVSVRVAAFLLGVGGLAWLVSGVRLRVLRRPTAGFPRGVPQRMWQRLTRLVAASLVVVAMSGTALLLLPAITTAAGVAGLLTLVRAAIALPRIFSYRPVK